MKSKFLVWAFMVIVAVLFPLQMMVSVVLPFSGAIYGLMLVVGAYTGMDQMTAYVKSKAMPSGMKYTGSYKKLLHITIGSLVLAVEGLVFQFILKDLKLPLDELFILSGVAIGLFVGGNKAANKAEQEGACVES